MVTATPKYKGPKAPYFDSLDNGLVKLPSSAPFKYTQVSKPEGDISIVEGFASTDNVDRFNEVVDPSKFDLAQIKSTTALLVNHSLWNDAYGNAVSPGSIKEAYLIKVRKSEDSEKFLLYDVNLKQPYKEVAKADMPGISVGDKGLYIVAEVYNPEVISMVRHGQLQAFSWRGHAVKETVYDMPTGRRFKSYAMIDCWEISLVNVPVNHTSSMLVSKSAISAVRYPSDMDTTAIKLDLKSRDLDDFDLLKSESGYYAVPQGFELISKSATGFIETPIGNGLSLLTEVDEDSFPVESFKSLFQGNDPEEDVMSDVAEVAKSEDFRALVEESVKSVKQSVMDEVGPMFASQNEAIKSVTGGLQALSDTVATMVSGIDGKFEEFRKSLADTLPAETKSDETTPAAPEGATEEVKSVEETKKSDDAVAALAAQAAQLAEVQKSLKSLAEVVSRALARLSQIQQIVTSLWKRHLRPQQVSTLFLIAFWAAHLAASKFLIFPISTL